MDEIARVYLILALSMGELEEGVVDAYYGPPELRDEARRRNTGTATLAKEARSLRERVNAETEGDRRRWLDRQLVALETIAHALGGEQLPYVAEVQHCFDANPEQTPDNVYADLRTRLHDLLPAGEDLAARLKARDELLTIPSDRVAGILEWVIQEVRQRSAIAFDTPPGESLSVSLVSDEPWAAYNWYDGNLASRIEFNTDLPARAHHLVYTMTHETFPGHHLEHAWKEQRLVRELGRWECSVQLINTPEAYISEGLGEVGGRLVIDAETWQSLLMAIGEQAGIALTPSDAEREWQINQALRAIRGSGGDAALQLHAEGRSRDEVRQFLIDDALRTPEQADKNLDFITHPLWRTYVFCYAGGEQLLDRWLEPAGDLSARQRRFFRLLTEQLTPSGIAEEIAAAT